MRVQSRSFRLLPLPLFAFLIVLGLGIEQARFHRVLWLPKVPGLVGMARWEPGTRSSAGLPWIALVGYPTLAVAFLWLFDVIRRRLPRPSIRAVALLVTLPLLAVAHARGLAQLKRLLGW